MSWIEFLDKHFLGVCVTIILTAGSMSPWVRIVRIKK
jgi:hypothetical protein